MATVFSAGTAKRTGRGGGAPRSKGGRGTAPPRTGTAAWDPARAGSPGSLNSLINEQIIPRLLMAHSHGVPRAPADGSLPVDPAEAAQFASLPLQLEADELLVVVEGILSRGVSVDSVFVDLLAPAARRLGQHWEDDDCDFLDVTMGLWRLQEVMREVTLRFPPPRTATVQPRAALFAPAPGDSHSLGALMVEEVFARAGWQTEVLPECKRKELLQILADRSFDVVGLTLSCDCPNASLADLIAAMRSVSKSPDLKILIGGRMVNARPEVADEVGADGTATDACGALALAERLVAAPVLSNRPGA